MSDYFTSEQTGGSILLDNQQHGGRIINEHTMIGY